ncbi:MAG: cytochrome C oxidase subunit IV family protein [Gemmatimonadales bacterium]|nr:cytochrome C oxidase subunit IV family protein [Gemmatimonadales bacterium]
MASHTDAHGEHLDHAHASAGRYIQIAVILFALTALEVLLYEAIFGSLRESSGALATSLGPWFVELLLALSALKFFLVAAFYMHLKFDIKALTWVFSFSLGLATTVILSLFLLFWYNRGLWWMDGPW